VGMSTTLEINQHQRELFNHRGLTVSAIPRLSFMYIACRGVPDKQSMEVPRYSYQNKDWQMD
jgi:hypothetical protein